MSLTRNLARTSVPGLAILTLSGLAATPAAAQTLITFDDFTATGYGSFIPTGYQGLNWNGFGALNTPLYSLNPSGYQAGTVSANNVAYSGFANGSISSFVPGSTFTLNSGYFTAAWSDGMSLSAVGYSSGVPVTGATSLTTLSATAPTLINFNFTGVDEVKFTAAGGTTHPGYAGSGAFFALDNLTVTGLPNASAAPEPSPLAALGLTGFGALGLVVKARRKKSVLS